MFSTTLRIPDELAAFLQEAARAQSLSVNAYLTRLVEERREEDRSHRLARDWAAYASDPAAQDVDYAAPAQADSAAERSMPYGAASRRKTSGKRK